MQILPRFGRKPSVIGHGLHMDEQGLAWVALRRERGRGLVLEHCLLEVLAPGCIAQGQIVELEHVEAALRRLQVAARSADASKLEPEAGDPPALALDVPAGLVSFHTTRVPSSLSESALAEQAQASMAAHLACSPEELALDFYVRPPDAVAGALGSHEKSLELHLAAVSRSAIEDRIAVVEAAGMPYRPVVMAISADSVSGQEATEQWPAAAGAAAYELAKKALEFNGTAKPAPFASFNFLPFRTTLRLHRQRVFMRLSAAVMLLILLATLAGRWVLSAQLAVAQTAHAEVRKVIQANEAEAKRRLTRASEIASLEGHEAVLLAFERSRQRLPLLLQELAGLLPQGLHLTGLRLEQEAYVLTGQAVSAAEVFELIDRLSRDSLQFTRPSLLGLSLPPEGSAAGLSSAGATAPKGSVIFSLRAQPP